MTNPKYKKIVAGLLLEAGIQINGPRLYDIQVHNENLYSRLLAEDSLGMGESYMDSWWDCNEIDEFVARVLRTRLEEKLSLNLNLLKTYISSKLLNFQTKTRSKKVVDEHYNLSTGLFMSFLDPYNQYTCGYFKDTDNLNIAQEQKLDLICRKLNLQKTDRVLDIGCGWGGFAKFAAKRYGCHVMGITISPEQAMYARKFTEGLPVSIQVLDYRDLKGEFDKILICGMIEHVGYKNYRRLFQIVHGCLRDNGLFLLHTIGNNNTTTSGDPWMTKYIFANGMLPSIKQLGGAMEKLFILEDLHNFGAYYDKTLMAWFANFDRSWQVLKQDYDERFYRMWKYYLLSCAGIFRARKTQLWQMVLSKRGLAEGYQSVR